MLSRYWRATTTKEETLRNLPMGKQYNKVVKRKRRQAYLQRKVAAQAAAVKPKTAPVAAKAPKKAPKAEAAPKAPKVPKTPKASVPAPNPEAAASIPPIQGADVMVNLETAPPAVETIEQDSTPESAMLQAGPQPDTGIQDTGSSAIRDAAPAPGE